MSKVFYAYTPYISPELKELGFSSERATVAVRLNQEKQIFEVGVSICMEGDNFSKKEGKFWALERLEAGFATAPFGNYAELAQKYANEGKNDGTERATIQYAIDKAIAIFGKMKTYKRRINEFENKK